MFEPDEIYPVSNFVNLCSKLVKSSIPPVWVSGEISNLSTPGSGHIYFSIKDANSQINCVLFKFSKRNLAFKLENGLEVMVRGGANLYEKTANFQIIINRVEAIGVGSLELGFEQLKKKLHEQGFFATEAKKPLIKFPQKIGIITSKTGAVIQDIIQVLGNRYPFAIIKIYDTPTQGDGASMQIINALNFADNDNNDTLIIARGGGSREDLWCFNDEDLALAVFNAKTPIISSIGHEVDSTIIDFVADVYAPTPSAAAMLATPDKLELLQKLTNFTTRLKNNQNSNLQKSFKLLENFNTRLNQPNFYNYYQLLDNLELRLNNSFKTNLKLNNSRLKSLNLELLQTNPQLLLTAKINKNYELRQKLLIVNSQIDNQKLTITNLNQKLLHIFQNSINNYQHNLSKNISSLNQLSPLNVLSRGYSITSKNNQAITSIKNLKSGDELRTKLSDGIIVSTIKSLK